MNGNPAGTFHRGARLAALALMAATLTACNRVPDCDSREATRLMSETIYALVRSEFRATGDVPMDKLPSPAPEMIRQAPRRQQVTDAYFPRLAMRQDVLWLKYRIAPHVAERHRFLEFPLYLMLDDSAILRRGFRIRLTDHEPLPDQQGETRVYTKVCRAKLWIEPAVTGSAAATPVTLTFSANAEPRGTKTSAASPFYIAINFFDASEPPLPFALADNEKLVLMMTGVTRDMSALPQPPQDAKTMLTRRALRALRDYYESTPSPDNLPYAHAR